MELPQDEGPVRLCQRISEVVSSPEDGNCIVFLGEAAGCAHSIVRQAVANAISNIPDKVPYVALLLTLLGDHDEAVRKAAAVTLAEISSSTELENGAKSLVLNLLPHLADPSEDVKSLVAYNLQCLYRYCEGDAEIASSLIDLLAHPTATTRQFAVHGVSCLLIRDTRVLRELVQAQKEWSDQFVLNTIAGIVSMFLLESDKLLTEAWTRFLEHGNSPLKVQVVHQLGCLADFCVSKIALFLSVGQQSQAEIGLAVSSVITRISSSLALFQLDRELKVPETQNHNEEEK